MKNTMLKRTLAFFLALTLAAGMLATGTGNFEPTKVYAAEYLYEATLEIASKGWSTYYTGLNYDMTGGTAGAIRQGAKLQVISEKVNKNGNTVAYVYSPDLGKNCYVSARYLKKVEQAPVATTPLYEATLDISSKGWSTYYPGINFDMTGDAAGAIRQGAKLTVYAEKVNKSGNTVAYVYSVDLGKYCYVSLRYIKKVEQAPVITPEAVCPVTPPVQAPAAACPVTPPAANKPAATTPVITPAASKPATTTPVITPVVTRPAVSKASAQAVVSEALKDYNNNPRYIYSGTPYNGSSYGRQWCVDYVQAMMERAGADFFDDKLCGTVDTLAIVVSEHGGTLYVTCDSKYKYNGVSTRTSLKNSGYKNTINFDFSCDNTMSVQSGDIIIYGCNNSYRFAHVGLCVETLGGGKFRTIEGNTSWNGYSNQCLNEKERSLSWSSGGYYIMGVLRPNYSGK